MNPQAIYYPGRPREITGPLARFLSPLPMGAATQWLDDTFSSGELTDKKPIWILDPFGTSPDLILEIAQNGYPILVTANNPILQFFLEFCSDLPSEAELRASLAELAAVKKGDDRLEPHIRNLYLTSCDQCKNVVEAEAFIWERRRVGESDQEVIEPFARIYDCPYCTNSGEYPITRLDLERFDQFSHRGLHYARALERVTSLDDPDRPSVEEALEVYLPRAVYALFTILNKLDGLDLTNRNRRNLEALLLSTFDKANSLWHYPSPRPRPLQLKIPSRFRENNIWLALENSVHQWIQSYQNLSPAPMTEWPKLPASGGGICLYAGRLKNFIHDFQNEASFKAVVTALPRPNQAFWTLSALWSGWLWGPEAVVPFKGVLRRRRYDWNWHSSALAIAFDQLKFVLKPNTPILALTGEAETGLISSALIGSNLAGIDLRATTLRVEQSSSQFTWESPPEDPSRVAKRILNHDPEHSQLIRQSALQAVREFLVQCGEPKSYLHIHAAALDQVTRDFSLHNVHQTPSEVLTHINAIFDRLFSDPGIFRRYGGSEKSLEVGLWWLREYDGRLSTKAGQSITPLSDRVEKVMVEYLIKTPTATIAEVDMELCRAFPGLLTPNADLISVCLDSYAHQPAPQDDHWALRTEDDPTSRQGDIMAMRSGLKSLGERFDFSARGEAPVIWYDKQGKIHYVFYIQASAILADVLFDTPYPPDRSFIVLPGGRANLAVYKQRQNPILREKVNRGWRFIKFRQLRWLVENPVLNLNILMEKLTLDALTYESPQIQLL